MHAIFHSEVLGTVAFAGSDYLVTASVEGRFESDLGKVSVHRDAFLRPTDISQKDAPTRPAWLPQPSNISEAMDAEEARPFVASIFTKWVRQVRAALETAGDAGTIHLHL